MKADEVLAKPIRAPESARVLWEHGGADGACNRAYYAMFDAARAALLVSGAAGAEMARTHNGLMSAFSVA